MTKQKQKKLKVVETPKVEIETKEVFSVKEAADLQLSGYKVIAIKSNPKKWILRKE